MSPYRDKDELVAILSALWDEIFATPAVVEKVAGEKVVVKFRYTDFKTALFIDISGETPRYYWDPGEGTPFDVEMIQSSETSHKFWMEQLNVPMALATRKVVAKGSVQKALKLLPALKPAFALYPAILRRMGREDLLETKAGKKKKKRRAFRLFRRKGPGTYDLHVIPPFPLSLAESPAQTSSPEKPPQKELASPVDILKTMYTIRTFEEHLARAFKEGELPTEAIHLSIGQESVAAAVCMNLRHSDYLNTTHRGHGHIIAKGADLKKMMAELYGKETGLCKGKGGSMHVTDGSIGMLGANGIVGAGYLLALGAGFSIKHQKKDDRISVIISGDGSVNQGMFHEAMNMISLMELPVLVVVENNLYGEFTRIDRHSAVTDIQKRASGYGMESFRVDGNDVSVLFSTLREIIEKMRSDHRPRLVEVMTYRWHGHMEGDPQPYKPPEEQAEFQQKDPLLKLEKELLDQGVLDTDAVAGIKKQVAEEIEEAAAFARDAEPPEADALLADLYTPEDPGLFFSGSFSAAGAMEERSVSGAINLALAQEMERDERVFLWGEDVTLGGYFNVTAGLVDRFGPDRIIDTPISENAIIGGAVGAAMTGMRPVAEILFSDFLTCCMDPIVNQAAKLRYMTGGQVSIPLTIRTPVGSGIGMAAQHSQAMERFFFGIPGLMVIAPSDAFTFMGLLKSAIRSNNPVLFFEHKLLYAEAGKVPQDGHVLPIGKARVIREGNDVTIVTYLLGVGIAREAAKLLSNVGIEVEIIDLLTLYPMDTRTILDSVAKTGHLVTLEEGPFTGSVGSEVISRVSLAGFGLLKAPPLKIAAPECPIAYAKNLENAMLPSAEAIAQKIESLFG
ncbi:MAG: SCP2 sterol-binding domain-containing protein [Deltaproteobacteria bacterium]|nr:SCP2 sterol-binding domain-containing protein [Deltaproteobacteria bacterium]